MDLRDYFGELARYHVWATRTLLDEYLAALSDEQWHREVGLFFRSVHRTLNHLLVADSLWYSRFAEGRSMRTALDAELHTGRAALCEALLSAAERWRPWLETLDVACMANQLTYTRSNGLAVCVPFSLALGHVFNHGTHHRGQISAALTAMGQAAPELDWIYKQQREMKNP